MSPTKGQSERRATQVRLPRPWPMLGVHGQPVGTVDACGIDLKTGRINYLMLETPWQTLKIPWQTVRVDEDRGRFQMRSPNSPRK